MSLTLEDVERALRAAGQDVDKVLSPVVRATAAKVADTQRANVLVESGRTKKSIKATGPGGAPFTARTTEAEIGPTWFVGRLVELGTATRGPHVFVANSLDPHLAAHTQAVLDTAARALLDGL